MAACNLKIELDEPRKIRASGEVVTGTVVVRCDKDTNCKGLVVSTRWSTHGRGNIASGEVDETTCFEGAWQAGQEYKYPFKLSSGSWPPTYYGTYLNVSHMVEARAKLAWATDPRAVVEFPLVASQSPDDLAPPSKKQSSTVSYVVAGTLGLVAIVFLVFLWWLIPVAVLVIGVFWFFKSFLPKQMTGAVVTELEPRRVQSGGVVRGKLSFTPKRNVNINAVSFTLAGSETCVSGSGSNRKTHTHELLKQVVELAGAQRLVSGQQQSFDIEFTVPQNAAPSMKLADNQVQWAVELRIDIPKWPDWAESIPLIVEPGAATEAADRLAAEQGLTAEDEWFEQVLQQLQESDDVQRMQLVLDAIREHEFTLSLEVEGEEDEPTSNYAPEVPGKWFGTYDKRRDLVVELFVPASAHEPQVDTVWRGRVGIVGYDNDEETLSVRMLG